MLAFPPPSGCWLHSWQVLGAYGWGRVRLGAYGSVWDMHGAVSGRRFAGTATPLQGMGSDRSGLPFVLLFAGRAKQLLPTERSALRCPQDSLGGRE